MVQFQRLTFGYGEKPLFQNLDLTLEPGTVYGLLGLNGAGKTSLLKLATGALRAESGGISVFGSDPGRREAACLADIAFVPEDPWLPAIKPSVWLDRYAVFRPGFDRERFRALSNEFTLEADKLLSKYSYGQRKKFALAAAFASGARLLLLDEPTNGLDIPSKTQFRRVLASAVDPERVVVVSTHQVRDLESLIDPAVILHGGRVLFTLSSEEMSAKLASSHLSDIGGPGIVYAEKDAVGWSALLASGDSNGSADLELVFNAAITAPDRLAAALRGETLSSYAADGRDAGLAQMRAQMRDATEDR
ncbi:MAG: ABC transporter ATP-binding protein [Spirochaetaceae bacterium]|nr:ABC transporter ATP-binding protein [Spirochaetaceae bacterium]